jgi:hypothetical protein
MHSPSRHYRYECADAAPRLPPARASLLRAMDEAVAADGGAQVDLRATLRDVRDQIRRALMSLDAEIASMNLAAAGGGDGDLRPDGVLMPRTALVLHVLSLIMLRDAVARAADLPVFDAVTP